MLQRGSSNPEGSLVVFTDTKMNADVACCSVRIRLRSRHRLATLGSGKLRVECVPHTEQSSHSRTVSECFPSCEQ